MLVGATTDGKDLAGMVVGRWPWGLLANAGGVTWDGDGPVVEATVLGGKAISRSAFTGGSGIVTVRPNATTAEPAATAGQVERRDAVGAGDSAAAAVKVLDRVAEAGAEASLEEARIVVVGGRGVGSPEGFAVVDGAGRRSWAAWSAPRGRRWTPAGSRTRGRSGRRARSSSRRCTSGSGVSGAMQHRVGMQSADAIVIVNRDPDAPIAEIADLFVVGDLFEVGPALVAELRSRRGG